MKEQTLRLPGNSVLKCGLLLGIILLAQAPLTAHGQQLVAGDTIRVKPSRSTEPKRQWTVKQPVPRWTEGTVVRLTPDTLWYPVQRHCIADLDGHHRYPAPDASGPSGSRCGDWWSNGRGH